jgi:hypothetical protein
MLLNDWKPKQFDVVVKPQAPLPVSTGDERGSPRGTLVLKTTIAGEHKVSLAPLVINEITVVGSRCGPFACPRFLAKGASVTPMIEDLPHDDWVLSEQGIG